MPRAPDRSIGCEVDMYQNKQNMIAIVAVRLNVIPGRHYLFAPQIGPSVLIFWESMPYCSKSIPFRLRLNYILKRYLQKEKLGRATSYRDSRLSALRVDRPLMNKTCSPVHSH
jgi:hypothetical protein